MVKHLFRASATVEEAGNDQKNKKNQETNASEGLEVLTRLSMLRSMASSRKAASVQTLWMEATTVPLDAGTPKMKVQIESRSN